MGFRRRVLVGTAVAGLLAAVALVVIGVASQPDVAKLSIQVDVALEDPENPSAGPVMVLTDASGNSIEASGNAAAPCMGLCPNPAYYWRFGWTAGDLAGHAEPFTLALVSGGKTIATTTAAQWRQCWAHGVSANEAASVRCPYIVPRTWYQTDMAHALMIAVLASAAIKAMVYGWAVRRRSWQWLGIAGFNAVALPAAWFYGFTHSGYPVWLLLSIVTMVWDIGWLVRLSGKVRRAVLVGVVAAVFVAAVGVGLGGLWQLWGSTPIY